MKSGGVYTIVENDISIGAAFPYPYARAFNLAILLFCVYNDNEMEGDEPNVQVNRIE